MKSKSCDVLYLRILLQVESAHAVCNAALMLHIMTFLLLIFALHYIDLPFQLVYIFHHEYQTSHTYFHFFHG